MAAAAKPATASHAVEDVLAAYIRAQLAVTGQLLSDLGRGSAYGIWQSLLHSGATLEDVELLHAWLSGHQPASTPDATA